MRSDQPLTRAAIRDAVLTRRRGMRVGLEVECGVVDPATGRAVPYHGRPGGALLLELLRAAFDTTPLHSDEHLVGLLLPDGARFSLEVGGALEYSSAPVPRLYDAVEATRAHLARAADLAHPYGMAVITGGLLPFDRPEPDRWPPRARVPLLRRHYRTLGAAAAHSDAMMGLTHSTQVSLDYTSEADLLEKLTIAATLAPVLAAVFVNSPLERGRPAGALSRRLQYWRRTDPERCAVPAYGVGPGSTLDDVLDWLLARPLLHRGDRPVPPVPLDRAMRDGFGDGTHPTIGDWNAHVSQVWPQVRLRRTLEMRIADGSPWPHFAGAAALWVGLLYDDAARRSARELALALSRVDLGPVTDDVAVKGLAASAGPYQVGDLCRELVALARRGLEARVDAGAEPPGVVAYLDPWRAVVDNAWTYADQILHEWHTTLGHDPAAWVRVNEIAGHASDQPRRR
jgi:glutamate--cysteine ligase